MKQLPLCLALVLLLSACSPAALQNTPDTADTPVEVTDCGEYIDRHGEITGAEARDQFLSAVESGSPADIRIIQYTIEGDPVTIDVSFDPGHNTGSVRSTAGHNGRMGIPAQQRACRRHIWGRLAAYGADNLVPLTGSAERNRRKSAGRIRQLISV